ncbi:MAG: FtsX-like permease family protein, partial [Gemmatimonadaceae bacterium]
GYDSRQLIFASATPLEDDTTRQHEIAAALPDLAVRLGHLPDVEHTALAMVPPMWGFTFEDLYLPGRDSLQSAGPFGQPIVSFVSPGYFEATGMNIRRGRGFSAADRPGAEQVVVVNELMARDYWPTGDALGSCIMLEKRDAPCRRIVGIVTDAHINRVIEQPAPAYFVPLAQAPAGDNEPGAIIVRARTGRVDAARVAVFREMKSELGTGVVPRVVPMEAVLAAYFHKWQLGATLFSVAGLLALVVAAVGIYSTIAYVVGQRRHEIGVRIALGAQGGHVARVVIAQGVKVVVVGVLIGVAAALALGKLVASLLYGVTAHDPVVLGAVAFVLILVAMAACAVPAWRAARVDPMETLRAE